VSLRVLVQVSGGRLQRGAAQAGDEHGQQLEVEQLLPMIRRWKRPCLASVGKRPGVQHVVALVTGGVHHVQHRAVRQPECFEPLEPNLALGRERMAGAGPAGRWGRLFKSSPCGLKTS
jgi:hypothetical protein